jgi:hypothetical protein
VDEDIKSNEQSDQKSLFKLFQGDRLANFECPIAVVMFQQERDDFFFTEFFILRPHSRDIRSGRMIGSGKHIGEYLELKGVAALITETAEHAARELEASIIETLTKEEQRWWNLNGRFNFNETDANTLRSLWMRGRMHDQMKDLARLSRCMALRQELGRVVALPHIEWIEEKPAQPPPF